MSSEGNIKTSILLILLKCIVVGYSNGNESFTGRLFSNYGLLKKLFHFFRYLIYSVFHDTFVKRLIKKLSFLSSNFKTQFQDVVYYMLNFGILKWRPFEYKVKGWKISQSIFGTVFSEIKYADILNFSWIKYFGNDILFLIK